jgi:LysR family hydrogen peroxide-inducible transcriptional activator
MLPEMALQAGILDHTHVIARRLDAQHPSRRIALVWRSGSPREKEFRLFAQALKEAHQTAAEPFAAPAN